MTRNVLAVGLLCAACCAAGYVRGFGVAETRGRALLAEQAEASASEREALAVAAAEAERQSCAEERQKTRCGEHG